MYAGVPVVGVADVERLHWLPRNLLHLRRVRTGYISYIVGNVSVIDVCRIVDEPGIATRAVPIVIIVACIHVLRRYEHPPVGRAVIIVKAGAKGVTGAKRRPAIETVSGTPAYPCRSPVASRYP